MIKKTIAIVICLLVGVAIYFYSGSDTYITHGLNSGQKLITNRLIINFIPDFLWALAYTMTLSMVMDKLNVAALIVVLSGIMVELLQKINIINGTCDPLDVAVETLGVLFIIFVLKGEKNEK